MPKSRWVQQLKDRSGANIAAVAQPPSTPESSGPCSRKARRINPRDGENRIRLTRNAERRVMALNE